MVRDELSVLSAFLAVAEERSFTRAAKRLNVSKSGLSHAIRRLEEDIGVRLLARTTRSLSPTDAGEQLLASLRPALADIRGTLTRIASTRDHPVGRLRLLVPRLASKSVLAPKLGAFARKYPDVLLEVVTDDSHVDVVAAGSSTRHRRRAGVPRGARPPRDAARPARPSLHQLPSPRGGHLSLGAGQGRSVRRGVGERLAGARRRRPDDPGGDRRRGPRVHGRRPRTPASRQRCARARPRGLVAAVSRVLPVLPEPSPAAGRAGGVDRDTAAVKL